MAGHRRKLSGYHQRKSSHLKKLEKQQLMDLEHKIDADLSSFLVLIEEGSSEQIAMAQQKAKNDLIKFRPDMDKLAQEIGGPLLKDVENFAHSADAILHSATGWIDESLINQYYRDSEKLSDALGF